MGAALVLLLVGLGAMAAGVLIGRYYVPDDRQLRRAARHSRSYMRALSHFIARDHETVINELRTVVEENVEDVEPYFALGAVFRSRGEHERAIRVHQALAVRERDRRKLRQRAMYELGLDFRAAGMPRRATRAMEEVLLEEPGHEGALRVLAALYEEQARFNEAAGLWQRLGRRRGESTAPREHHLLVAAAQAAIGRDDLDSAKQLLKAAQKHEESAHFHVAAGELAAARANHRGAKDRFRQALIAEPALAPHLLPALITAEQGLVGDEPRDAADEDAHEFDDEVRTPLTAAAVAKPVVASVESAQLPAAAAAQLPAGTTAQLPAGIASTTARLPAGDTVLRAGSSGAANAPGSSGAANAPGPPGVANASGASGTASAPGASGAASAPGASGAASAAGVSGAASAAGASGAANPPGASGVSGAANASGTAPVDELVAPAPLLSDRSSVAPPAAASASSAVVSTPTATPAPLVASPVERSALGARETFGNGAVGRAAGSAEWQRGSDDVAARGAILVDAAPVAYSVATGVLALLADVEAQTGPRLELALIRAQLMPAGDPVAGIQLAELLKARFPESLAARVAAARLALSSRDASGDASAVRSALAQLVSESGALAWALRGRWQCAHCGNRPGSFSWRCGQCRRWGTLRMETGVEPPPVPPRERRAAPRTARPEALLGASPADALPTATLDPGLTDVELASAGTRRSLLGRVGGWVSGVWRRDAS